MGWLQRLWGRDEAAEKGAAGEDAVADKLAEKGWFRVRGLCLRNLYLPTPDGTAEIDLLYLTRKGIFVIESKIIRDGSAAGRTSPNGPSRSMRGGTGWAG